MSALITDKLITKCGGITNPTLGGYVDAAGNVVGSAQFLANFIVDYAGNLGSIQAIVTDCTVIATIIGSALPPGEWEMSSGTTETVGQNDGTISNNYTANTAAPLLHTFVSKNATGYLTGNVAGTGTWTIKAGPEAIAGTGYVGAGLLVATGDNAHTGLVNMEVGTKIQFGADCSNALTRVRGNLTLAEGAVATQYTAFIGNTFLTQALNNNGTYNVTGCGDCGKGGVGLATTVVNNGIINIDKASWRNQSTWSGTGTVNVKTGGTFQLSSNPISNTTRINLNGNGWKDANCVEQGALHAITSGSTIGARINVQSASTIKTASGVNGVILSGLVTGSAPLTVTTLGTTLTTSFTFSNTANTYNGTITVDRTILPQSDGASLRYANMVLVNGGRIHSSASQLIGSLSSSDPTTAWALFGSTQTQIVKNGITTFAGNIIRGGTIGNVYLEGGDTNQLTLTNTGHTGGIYARNGSKIILQGAIFTGAEGQARVTLGSTVSAGTSTTASVTVLGIDATSALDVRSITPTSTGLLRYTSSQALTAGWKVNALDPLQPGTYPILQKPNTTVVPMPTLGINNTGYNVTFTQVGNVINMVVS
jgi:hypothetical protein